jgi:hypothetical protein
VLELDNRVVRPKALSQFLSRYYIAGAFEKRLQDSERLIRQPDRPAAFALQLTRAQVESKS